MRIEAHLNFDGRCDEAIEFYRSALGATVSMLMRFKEMPGTPTEQCSATQLEKVMHASVMVGQTRLMMSDGHCTNRPSFAGITLSLAVATDAEAAQKFTALADSGRVTMPLTKTFFATSFGTVTDRFGVNWMVVVNAR